MSGKGPNSEHHWYKGSPKQSQKVKGMEKWTWYTFHDVLNLSSCCFHVIICHLHLNQDFLPGFSMSICPSLGVLRRIALELRQSKGPALLAVLGAVLAGSAIACSVASALLQSELSQSHVLVTWCEIWRTAVSYGVSKFGVSQKTIKNIELMIGVRFEVSKTVMRLFDPEELLMVELSGTNPCLLLQVFSAVSFLLASVGSVCPAGFGANGQTIRLEA